MLEWNFDCRWIGISISDETSFQLETCKIKDIDYSIKNMLRQIEFITINMFLLQGWCLFLFVKNYLQEYSRICTII